MDPRFFPAIAKLVLAHQHQLNDLRTQMCGMIRLLAEMPPGGFDAETRLTLRRSAAKIESETENLEASLAAARRALGLEP